MSYEFNTTPSLWESYRQSKECLPLRIIDGHIYQQDKSGNLDCLARFRDQADAVEVLTVAGFNFQEATGTWTA